MKNYVTGFLFSTDSSHVVLIQKINPEWQRGLFNGVGGKIEPNELPHHAMSREFEEETGVKLPSSQWHCYAKIHRPNCYNLDVYFAHSDLAFEVKTIEAEEVYIVKVNELPVSIVPNLKWLIPMALDKQADFTIPVTIQEVGTERITA